MNLDMASSALVCHRQSELAHELLRRWGWATYSEPETGQHWYCTLQEPYCHSWKPPWEYIIAKMVAPHLAIHWHPLGPLHRHQGEPPSSPPRPPGVPPPQPGEPLSSPPRPPEVPPPCTHHSQLSWDGEPWPVGVKVQIWAENIVPSYEKLGSMWSMMDARIFADDKTGWDESWPKMSSAFHLFEWTRMATRGGYCGASAQCLNCKSICRIQWDRHTPELELAAQRAKWLSFFGCRFTVPGDPKAVRVL